MGELVKDEDGEEIERYEVQLCGMKDDGEGGLTYCDSTHETPEILEDEDFNTWEEASFRASELILKYGNCPYEEY